MISTLDLLYLSLAISTLVIAGFFASAAYQFSLTLKTARRTIENIETTTDNVKTNLTDLTEGLKYGALGVLAKILGKRGGDYIGT